MTRDLDILGHHLKQASLVWRALANLSAPLDGLKIHESDSHAATRSCS